MTAGSETGGPAPGEADGGAETGAPAPGGGNAALSRRRFLRRAGALLGAGAAAGLGYAYGEDTWDLGVTRLEVPVPRLPADLDGLRVAHVTDLHAGPDVPTAYISRALELVRQERADLIALTGDFVSHDWRHLRRIEPELALLKARLGVYACLGNHDQYFGGAPRITASLERLGVRVLSNAATPFPGRRDAWIVGVDDPVNALQDFDMALRHVPPGSFTLLLAHAPDVADAVADLQLDLTLAGHTHGGQICLPLIGPPVVPTRHGPKYASGLFDCRGAHLFVSRGVGIVEPLVRFLCPPEVAVLRLRRADWPLSHGHWGLNLERTLKWGHREMDQLSRSLRHLRGWRRR